MQKNLDIYFSVPIPDHIPQPLDAALRLLIRALVNHYNDHIDQRVYTKDETYRTIMMKLYDEVESELWSTDEYLYVNRTMTILDVENYIYNESEHFNLFAQYFCRYFTNNIITTCNHCIEDLKARNYRHTSTLFTWQSFNPTTVIASVKYF